MKAITSQYALKEHIQLLQETGSHEEQLYKMLELYMDLYPVKNAYLFRYSPLGFLGEGIILLNSTGLVHIGEIRDDIRSLSIIFSSIRERKAKYCSGIEFLKATSSKYIFYSNVNSMSVVPISFGSAVIGYICTTEFETKASIDEKMLTSFTLFGKLAGQILEKTDSTEDSKLLSKRELEVMKRISWGESTKEMANSMEISELTVKQYVKTAIKKLGAHNRSHAVVELIRRGIIS
ncbi:response regulator transcription factor [Fictibacillus fluitans]|uniref:LuxR C-terminal-related transcriptional regulator n=1 Tax=Fictibacillus fluitans TaxID=3058422 RepID=A0ABT8HUE0_9BACL|nr:LuxR C-terminal-related transcriptional regulator [Fictibacillus sp. NE201]MDN4524105.1 LuxR C-terminal-related transcriptional regulator [Fictibacillus sp. NE201]